MDSIEDAMTDDFVRWACITDLDDLEALDAGPARTACKSRIRDQCVSVFVCDETIVGLCRWTFLWTTVPFLELIVIAPGFRGRDGSRKLLHHLCDHLKSIGHVALLSSSQTDEPEAQEWHRHMGFMSNGVIENIADDNIGELVFRIEFE